MAEDEVIREPADAAPTPMPGPATVVEGETVNVEPGRYTEPREKADPAHKDAGQLQVARDTEAEQERQRKRESEQEREQEQKQNS